jgi:hypothetical protein
MVYPHRCVALLLWKTLVFFDDLSDLLKKRANLWLGTRLFSPITRWLGMLQDLF